MTLFKYFARAVLIAVGVLMLMVISDLVRPQKEIKIKLDPAFVIYPEDDILNPENHENVVEVVFNMGENPWDMAPDTLLIKIEEQFNERY